MNQVIYVVVLFAACAQYSCIIPDTIEKGMYKGGVLAFALLALGLFIIDGIKAIFYGDVQEESK